MIRDFTFETRHYGQGCQMAWVRISQFLGRKEPKKAKKKTEKKPKRAKKTQTQFNS